MYRDDETDPERKHPLDYKPVTSDETPAWEYGPVSRRVRPGARPASPGRMKPLSSPQSLPVSSGTRRGPSYPLWEKPPSGYAYPRLRGQEVHRPIRPLFFVAVVVALVAGFILAFSALTGHGGGIAGASGSAKPSPSPSSSAAIASPSRSASPSVAPAPSPSPSADGGTPAPPIIYKKYLVKTGDTVSNVAGRYGLKSWELLLANPKITPPNYILKVGTYINIPPPGQLTPAPPTTPSPTPTPTPVAP